MLKIATFFTAFLAVLLVLGGTSNAVAASIINGGVDMGGNDDTDGLVGLVGSYGFNGSDNSSGTGNIGVGGLFLLADLPARANFIVYEKSAGSAPFMLDSGSTVVSVYTFSSFMPLSVSPNDWDGKILRTPGLVGPYDADKFIELGKSRFIKSAKINYCVVISNNNCDNWFSAAIFDNYEDALQTVSSAQMKFRIEYMGESSYMGWSTPLPEPSTALIALTGVALLFRRRRRGE